MPMYEYMCPECNKRVEELQGFDDPPPKCKKCNKAMTKCFPKSVSFHLKGGGWFKDGYHKGGKK